MTNLLQAPIIYLETADIENGKISDCDIDIAIVFLFASFCGHCNDAKPALVEFAENNPDIPVFVVWADSKVPADAGLIDKLQHLNTPGFPHYAIAKKGVIMDKPIEGRSAAHLEKFARS
jgi:thiol-disulfide isomerase/thioredoxin